MAVGCFPPRFSAINRIFPAKTGKEPLPMERLLEFLAIFVFVTGSVELPYPALYRVLFLVSRMSSFPERVSFKKFFSRGIFEFFFAVSREPRFRPASFRGGSALKSRVTRPIGQTKGFSIYGLIQCPGDTFVLRHYGKMPLSDLFPVLTTSVGSVFHFAF